MARRRGEALDWRVAVPALAALVGLALGLVLWHAVAQARREERRGVWLAYLRGPLAESVSGMAGADGLLARPRWTWADRKRLSDAAQALHRSWEEAREQQPAFEMDAFFRGLDSAVDWHANASQLAENWPRLDPENAAIRQMARDALAGIRKNLALRVRSVFEALVDQKILSREEEAESRQALERLEGRENQPKP